MEKYTGLSIIIHSTEEYDVMIDFLGKDNLYVTWMPQMAEIETSIIIFANKTTFLSTGSVGSSKHQRELGIRTVLFNEYFKPNFGLKKHKFNQ